MPIVGLTDRTEPRFVRFGKIRKGEEKPAEGNRPGRDLDHFRVTFEPEWAHLEKPFKAAFPNTQQNPLRAIPVMLLGNTPADCFTAWYESWTATALQNRCDGKTKSVSLVNGRYVNGLACTKGPEAVGHDDSTFACQCRMIGRLAVGIPAVWSFPGVDTPGIFILDTHSIHDIITLTQRLDTIHRMYGSLLKLKLTLSRKKTQISRFEKGQRVKTFSWLLHITEHMEQFRMLGSGQPDNSLPAPRVYEDSPLPGALPSTTKPDARAPSSKSDGGYQQFMEEEQSWNERGLPPSAPPRPPKPSFPPPFDTGDFRAIIKISRNARHDTNPNAPKYHLIDEQGELPVWTLTPIAQMFGKGRDEMADWIGHDRPLEQPLYIRIAQTKYGGDKMADSQIDTLQNPAIALQFADDFRQVIRSSGRNDKAKALKEMLGIDKITDSTLTIGEAIAKAGAWLSKNTYIKADGTRQRGQFPEHPHKRQAAQQQLDSSIRNYGGGEDPPF